MTTTTDEPDKMTTTIPPTPDESRLPNIDLPHTATNHLLRETIHDRIVGCIVGSALGDTIGLYTEFLSRERSREAYPSASFTLTGSQGPTPFLPDLHRAPKDPGHWTDDTDHALLLVLGYLHGASTDDDATGTRGPAFPTPIDLASRLLIWVQQGLKPLDTMPLGLGRLVSSVVSTKGFPDDPASVAREYWIKTGRTVAPNGSLMRTHPVGVMGVWKGEEETFEVAAGLSRTTHVDLRCVVACVIGSGLVRGLVRGEVVDEGGIDGVVERGVEWVRGLEKGEGDPELDVEELGRYVGAGVGSGDGTGSGDDVLEALKLDDPAAIGYVYKTLGSGVMLLRLAMRRVADSKGSLLAKDKLFEELITDLIMRGGDADTNACFAGAVLGAYLGYGKLPDHWKHGLLHGEWLMGKADAICQVLGVKGGRYVGEEDKDTWLDAGKGMIDQQEMEVKWMLLQQKAGQKIVEAKAKAEAAAKARSRSGWTGKLPWQGKDKAR